MRRVLTGFACLLALSGAGCSDETAGEEQSIRDLLGPQLAYLEPDSSAVVAVDLRYDGDNWETLKPVVERSLQALRERQGSEDVPEDLDSALAEVARELEIDFEDELRPALDGHLVVGVKAGDELGDERVVAVYRTEEGNLRELVRKLPLESLEPVPGHPDADRVSDDIAVVGDDTLIAASGEGDPIVEALDRAEDGVGVDAGRLETARRDVGFSDPLVLATGDLGLARAFVDDAALERAGEIPYLAAIERISAGLDVGDDDATGRLEIVTGGGSLEAEDLPVGPAGELELPRAEGVVVGASRDQSRTTTFASRVVRALYADSDFVAAVERAERDLGASFEDEVLRQFDCPSVSVFDNDDGSEPGFGARSCVRDPERMRELLPRLAPHLPRILSAMQGLGSEGLLGLLLVAPDAPLTPGALGDLAQIVVDPLRGGDARPEEDLYELDVLPDPNGPALVP